MSNPPTKKPLRTKNKSTPAQPKPRHGQTMSATSREGSRKGKCHPRTRKIATHRRMSSAGFRFIAKTLYWGIGVGSWELGVRGWELGVRGSGFPTPNSWLPTPFHRRINCPDMANPHFYRAKVSWTGGEHGPAVSYESYSRAFRVDMAGKAPIEG